MSGPTLHEEILRLTLDTTVVVAAFRSSRGASRRLFLEAAINGYAHAIVTFNTADFLPAAAGFGIKVLKPGTIIRERFSR